MHKLNNIFPFKTLLGCAKISDIKPELVVHELFYKAPRNKL